MENTKLGKTLVVIVGPTASGKTALSIDLARKLETEIISADSRQLYREMNIGTAKPSSTELHATKHHFINSHSIKDDYDAAQFGRDALTLIEQLFQKYRYLVLCGGSGLYVKAVCEGFDDIPDVSPDIREELTGNYERFGLVWLQSEMQKHDPEYFQRVDQSNPQRLLRALEVKLGTGASILSFQKNIKYQRPFKIVKIGLEMDREKLYERIDQRMDSMIAQGLFEEAVQLYPFKKHNALQTVGYQEIFDYIEKKYDKAEAVRLLKRNSRRYAKRQLTWFKRDPEIHWVPAGDLSSVLKVLTAESNSPEARSVKND